MKALLLVLLLPLSLLTTGFGPPVMTDGAYPPVRLYPEQLAAMYRAARPPGVTAQAALMYDLDSHQTLYAFQEHLALPPASTAKIMTALLVLQRGDLAAQVTISPWAAGIGGSTMGLQAGENLTVEELLYGLLIPSGNDASIALAEYIAGSEAEFVKLMNETAAEMQLAETYFTNPHGLDQDGQTTSAADLLVMTRAALAYPIFAGIVAMPTAEVAGHSMINTNQLLGFLEGADGIKTGTTDEAGECLVASVTRRGHRLVLILLHSNDRYADARSLFDFADETWAWRRIALPDNALAWTTGPDGRTYRLKVASEADLFLPAWQWPLAQTVRIIDSRSPFTSTASVGALHLTINGQVLARVPLTVYTDP